jgi:hypothetical protein
MSESPRAKRGLFCLLSLLFVCHAVTRGTLQPTLVGRPWMGVGPRHLYVVS